MYSIYLSIHLSICLCILLPIYLSIDLSIYLSLSLSLCLSVCLSIYLSVCKIENKAILRDVLRFWTWQHQKRSKSARLPQCLKLTTSKTKQFCETSSSCELDNVRNEAILRDFLNVWSWQHQKRSNSARRPSKMESWAQSLTALMKMSLVLRLPRKMHLCRSSSNVPRLPSFVEMLQNPYVLLTFEKVHNPLRLPRETTSEPPKVARHVVLCTFWLRNVLRATTVCTFSTSQLPKVVRTWCVLYILTSKCASCHNGVRFFDISTSKSGPELVCCVHFDFEMCFAPQLRAIFHLPSGLRTRCFSEPIFRPSRATNHWKNTVFRDFPTFSRSCIFFLVTLSLLWSSLLLFSSLRLFPSLLFICPYRRKFDF